MSGWRYEHLKGMVRALPECVGAIANLLWCWSENRVPQDMAEVLTGGKITPLLEGTKVRPAVVQETLVRIMSGALGEAGEPVHP
jgi:hypothetical protein